MEGTPHRGHDLEGSDPGLSKSGKSWRSPTTRSGTGPATPAGCAAPHPAGRPHRGGRRRVRRTDIAPPFKEPLPLDRAYAILREGRGNRSIRPWWTRFSKLTKKYWASRKRLGTKADSFVEMVSRTATEHQQVVSSAETTCSRNPGSQSEGNPQGLSL